VGKTILINGHSQTTFQIIAPTSGRVRITGIEFDGKRIGAGIHVSGPIWGEFQIDHSKFFEMAGRAVHVEGLLSGLIYHNAFIDIFKAVDTYAGTTYMNTSWQMPLTLGTTQCVVTEDNTFTYHSWYPRSAAAVSSHGLGGRATWRHNIWQNNIPGLDFFPIIDAHGNQEAVNLATNTGTHRGTRQLELYNNIFKSNVGSGSTAAPGQIRGGTAVIFNNTYTGTDVGNSYEMREEDGPNRFNRLTTYPGYDQHWVWIWNNISNGTVMGWHASSGSEAFVISNVNIFTSPKPNYTPLTYPHPWRNAEGTSDTDGDELVDSWEILYFGSIADPRAQPGMDVDGDGFDNLAEQSAGTMPINSKNRLAITDERFSTVTSFRIEWNSISEKTYEVQVSTNMTSWNTVTNITATFTTTSWTDTLPGTSGRKFYRVRVP
jgi:hypothetical protein